MTWQPPSWQGNGRPERPESWYWNEPLSAQIQRARLQVARLTPQAQVHPLKLRRPPADDRVKPMRRRATSATQPLPQSERTRTVAEILSERRVPRLEFGHGTGLPTPRCRKRSSAPTQPLKP